MMICSSFTTKFDLAKSIDLEVIQKIKPEVIIHTAALTNVDECEANKELAYKINVEGTKRLVEIAKDSGVFFVYVSTDYVFSGDKGRYKEEDGPKFGLDKDLIIASRMEELKWVAKRPENSSLDTSKVARYLKEEPYSLDRALGMLKSELKNKG